MCIIAGNEPEYCACIYVYNVLYVYNCIHEKAIKPSCILYLEFIFLSFLFAANTPTPLRNILMWNVQRKILDLRKIHRIFGN